MAKQGKIRIIGGEWRSRLLRFPDAKDLRPTPDMVRETLFNWLRDDIPNSVCLDLFAGSGALGFEAASRGSKKVIMVDNAPPVIHALRENAKALNADQVEIVKSSALEFLKKNQTKLDLVFIDPPYNSDTIGKVCDALDGTSLLNPDAFIYLESAKPITSSSLPPKWDIIREKKCGMVHSTLVKL